MSGKKCKKKCTCARAKRYGTMDDEEPVEADGDNSEMSKGGTDASANDAEEEDNGVDEDNVTVQAFPVPQLHVSTPFQQDPSSYSTSLESSDCEDVADSELGMDITRSRKSFAMNDPVSFHKNLLENREEVEAVPLFLDSSIYLDCFSGQNDVCTQADVALADMVGDLKGTKLEDEEQLAMDNILSQYSMKSLANTKTVRKKSIGTGPSRSNATLHEEQTKEDQIF